MTNLTNIGQLDAELSDRRTALAKVQEALVELDGNPARELLASTALSGQTADSWTQADQELQLVWKWFLAISDRLKAVAERRGTKSTLPPAQLEALDAELRQTAAEILPDTPFPEALRASRRPASLAALIAAMRSSAEQVTQVVKNAEAAWDRLIPRLAEIDSAAAAVESAALDAGVRTPNDLTVARRLIGELRQQCTADPLCVQGDRVAAIEQGVERARVAVQQALRARQELDGQLASSLAEAERAIEELALARGRQRESAEKIRGSDATLAEFDQTASELDTVRATLRDAAAAAAGGGRDGAARSLGAANQRAAAVLQRARRLTASAGSDLATRDELRGRLDAYRAKARAIGRGEDLQLEQLYRQALEGLYSAPCDLPSCTALVVAYQQALSPSAARSGR
ncbi:MAG: hypothetical protein ACYDHH_08750 [Solirubrobacteraceae bacterium]